MDKEELKNKSKALDFLLDMLTSSEDCPIDLKVLKARKEVDNAIYTLLSADGFHELENEPKLALISYFNQGVELIKDITEKITPKEADSNE